MNSENIKSDQKKTFKRQNQLFSFILPINGDVANGVFTNLSQNVVNFGGFLKQEYVSFKANPKGKLVMFSTLLLLFGAAFLMFYLQPNFESFNTDRLATGFGKSFFIVTMTLLAFKVSLFLYSVYLYIKYKPIESVSDELLPICTVIVPAYNEGELVWHTLKSLADSDYPKEKLQILAIDDGSKDDTWEWILKAKDVLGDRLSIFKQPKNMGKRHALYRGFNVGTGDIFVTVDSDSIVKPDTLRNLVSPFVHNEDCGAVAGNVQVLNNEKALIPKMLNVSFVFSFEFVRSAESALGSVLCTPGALAAYRRDAVFNCLPEWINQTFMGKASDIGEDRAMTNMILQQGFKVLFQRNAYVLTNVPETYTGLYKMFIRWGRSNVRENLNMTNYIFKNFRKGSKFGTRLLFLDQSIKLVMAYPAVLFMIYFIVAQPLLFITASLFSILVLSSIQVLFYAKRYSLSESFWAYSYSLLYAFGLFWITPYAIITASKSGWLTRELTN
ncbi:glycosyltransferase [Flavobacterium ardleyense]|uniref:N-acetylglucosaminyltransferase n=1 Tax=Flavobacterium ardleyense TaxID=2038737 RepID=A0ABW5Z3V8_9FLAO